MGRHRVTNALTRNLVLWSRPKNRPLGSLVRREPATTPTDQMYVVMGFICPFGIMLTCLDTYAACQHAVTAVSCT